MSERNVNNGTLIIELPNPSSDSKNQRFIVTNYDNLPIDTDFRVILNASGATSLQDLLGNVTKILNSVYQRAFLSGHNTCSAEYDDR